MAVQLRGAHLLIKGELLREVFGAASQVRMVYYPKEHSLLLAPVEDAVFSQLHKTSTQMLKTRNLDGDGSVSLRELLIDYDLNDADRPLSFEQVKGLGILKSVI